MRIALATKDQDLIEQIGAMVDGSGCTVEALEPGRALDEARYEIRLIDCAQLEPTQRRLAGLALSADDWLLLLSEPSFADGGGPGASAGCALQIVVATSERRADLLERLEEALPRRAWSGDAAEQLVGRTSGMLQVKQQVRRVARFRDISVIVIGESGTGKELVAEAIHKLASGDRDPFLAINCAAIPEALFEAELFGCEATTGDAPRPLRTGLLEAARAGTVFLDAVGAMPLLLQPKLLRALETGEFRRVGSEVSIPLRARVIGATDHALVSDGGGLHRDLQFRLAGFTIAIPPLRERLDDMELLAQHFVLAFGLRQGVSSCSITTEALRELRRLEWPGNVRQLRKTLEHAAVLSVGGVIDVRSVSEARRQLENLNAQQSKRSAGADRAAGSGSTAEADVDAQVHGARTDNEDEGLGLDGQLGGARVRGMLGEGGGLRDIERDLILAAFRESDGNLSQTSRLLGVPRTTLRGKLRKYGAL